MSSHDIFFDAIGTRWHLSLEAELSPQALSTIELQVKKRIDDYDVVYSRFRADSLVTKMSRQAGTYQLPPDAKEILPLYRQLYDLTSGAFTPLIGNVLEQAGYDANYSLEPKQLTIPKKWDEVIDYDGDQTITIKQPAMIDIGAGGKGHLIDLVAKVLEKNAITSYCIDAGGDIIQRSTANQPREIGLENPSDLTEAIGIAHLLNASICGSAGNRRTWKNFHHIINPHTLQSPRHILAVWVVASTTLLADTLATALFFVPAELLVKAFSFEYVIVNADQSAEISLGFPGELFTV